MDSQRNHRRHLKKKHRKHKIAHAHEVLPAGRNHHKKQYTNVKIPQKPKKKPKAKKYASLMEKLRHEVPEKYKSYLGNL